MCSGIFQSEWKLIKALTFGAWGLAGLLKQPEPDFFLLLSIPLSLSFIDSWVIFNRLPHDSALSAFCAEVLETQLLDKAQQVVCAAVVTSV